MSDQEQDREELEREEGAPRRPRVIDKRISARSTEETRPGEVPPPPEAVTQREEEASQGVSSPTPQQSPAGTTPPPTAPTAARDPSSAGGPSAPAERVWTPEQEAEARQMAQEISETPSFEWVVNAAVTLANVAATKLELGGGADAQLAIDALAGLINSVGPRLQQAETPLRQTLAQLQLAYAQRLSPPRSPDEGTNI
jgi:hypothetical protein